MSAGAGPLLAPRDGFQQFFGSHAAGNTRNRSLDHFPPPMIESSLW